MVFGCCYKLELRYKIVVVGGAVVLTISSSDGSAFDASVTARLTDVDQVPCANEDICFSRFLSADGGAPKEKKPSKPRAKKVKAEDADAEAAEPVAAAAST